MPDTRPNILFFFTDQQRWDCSGLHGNPLDLMPNFDRLAQAGTHLANCFTCQPVCGPARACLQTGTFATRNGSFRNNIPLNRELPNLAGSLADAGYTTAYIGKWHLGDHASPLAVKPEDRGGYQHWLAANVVETTRNQYSSDAYDCRLWDEDGQLVRLPGYRADAMTDAAIRFVGKPHSNPWLLFLSLLEPHHQNHRDDYPAPDGWEERYRGRWTPPDLAALGGSSHHQLAGYYGMVKRIDDALGRVYDALRSTGQLDNTILVFTSDHGCHFKTRNSEYKRSCHESSIRVPAMIHGPGFMAGGRRPELFSLVDFAPTLLQAAGLPVPDTMQGQPLLPRMQKTTTPWPEEVFVQYSENVIGRAIRTRRWKYAIENTELPANQVASADEYHEAYLYDLQSDPYELVNLIGKESHLEVANLLRQRLLNRMQKAGEAPPKKIHLAPERASSFWVSPEEVNQ
jgi:arylsulfatase A-like enzyme